MTRKSKFPNTPVNPGPDDDGRKADLLPGWPGYRTRDGRSGYDPVDTRTEAAHISGAFIRGLFTGNLRINHPLPLFLTGMLGVLLVMPALITVTELVQGNLFSWEAGLTLAIAGLVGLALLTNFIKNLFRGKGQ